MRRRPGKHLGQRDEIEVVAEFERWLAIRCCSAWWARHKLMVQRSEGVSAQPPSVPERTWAHSIGPARQPGTEQRCRRTQARCAGHERACLPPE